MEPLHHAHNVYTLCVYRPAFASLALRITTTFFFFPCISIWFLLLWFSCFLAFASLERNSFKEIRAGQGDVRLEKEQRLLLLRRSFNCGSDLFRRHTSIFIWICDFKKYELKISILKYAIILKNIIKHLTKLLFNH
jgi:hypothetical protein